MIHDRDVRVILYNLCMTRLWAARATPLSIVIPHFSSNLSLLFYRILLVLLLRTAGSQLARS